MSEPVGKSLIRSLAKSDFANSLFDAAEIAIDSGISSDLLKEIPIFGTLANIARAGDTLRSHLFTKKLLRFLGECASISKNDREEFLNRLSDKPEAESELGENLLLALEKLDNVRKPTILARFFVAYMRFEIDLLTFTRLAQALERFNLEFLPVLQFMYHPELPALDVTEDIHHELSLAGLMTANLSNSGSVGGGALYMYSPIGRLFLKIGFNFDETK